MRGEVFHRMDVGGLNIAIRVVEDVLVFHPDGAFGAIGILHPSPPDRVALETQNHALMHIK